MQPVSQRIAFCGTSTSAPSAAVQNSASPATGDVVDFRDGINNGTEALLMPMADLVSGMLAGQQFNGNARVEVTCGDQKLSYVSKQPTGTHVEIPVEVNGQSFTMAGETDGASATLEGKGPLGDVSCKFGAEMGGLSSEGNVGGIAFKEEVSIDPFAGAVNITGQANGEDFKLKLGADGTGDGSLGDKPVKVKMEPGPNGTFLVHETWGTTQIEKVISAA